jgi:hypothetical protein
MKKNSVGLLKLEMAVLECFLEKTPLSPLGINLKCLILSLIWNTQVIKNIKHWALSNSKSQMP